MLTLTIFPYDYGAMKGSALLAAVVFMTIAPQSAIAAPSLHYKNVLEALQAAHESTDKRIHQSALAAASRLAPQSDQEMQTLISGLDGLALQTGHADDPGNLAIAQEAQSIGSSLALSTSPAMQPLVARWLEKEVDHLPRGFTDPEVAKTPAETARAICDYERINGLLKAAEGGKNSAALAAVRRLAAKGGFALSVASRALGTLGDSTDLDRLIDKVKHDPHAQVDMSRFGPPMVDRILKEVNDPSVAPDVKNRLADFMAVVSRHDLLPKYQSLLRSSNPAVVHAAASGMYRSLTPADLGLVQTMLKDPSDTVRVQALAALQNKHLWTASLAPDLIRVLQQDPDDFIRALAASRLGVFHVISAEPALTKALQDPSMLVRQAAQYALKRIKV